MKVLLLRPNSEVPSAAPPQGLLYVGSCLREFGGHEVAIYDARNLESTPSQIADAIKRYKPDALGLTAFSMEKTEVHAVAAAAKELFPDMPIVIGGPYPSSTPEDALSDKNIDVAIIGEGERSGTAVFDALQNGKSFEDIKGIAFRKNGSVVRTPEVDLIYELDEIPLPAWDLIDVEDYFSRKGKKRKTMNQHQMKQRVLQISTTRGCPYHCAYCHKIFGKAIRKRSLDNVVNEIRMLKEKYQVEELEIIDDIFNLDLERAKEFFRRMINEKMNLKYAFPNGLRSDRMDEEFLDLMKEAGVYRLVFAIESGTPRIQKLIKKNVKLEAAQKNIELAAERGFSLGGFFMLGFPSETEEEIWNTINFALESKLGTATFFMVTPFPGTDLFQLAVDMGHDLSADYEHYQKVSINVSNVPTERLEKLRSYALRKFYLNPKRILRYVRTTPWRDRFWMKIYILIMATLFNYEK